MPVKKSDISYSRSVRLLNNSKTVKKSYYKTELPVELRKMAFYIADLEKSQKLADLTRLAIVKANVEGKSFKEFINDLDKGVLEKLSKARLQTVYRNNLNTAYNQAKRIETVENMDVTPYLVYDAVDDANTSESHAALDNLVLAADDPRWDDLTPPLRHNCRCRVIAASESLARRVKERDTNQYKTERQKIANSYDENNFNETKEYGQFSTLSQELAEKQLKSLPQSSPIRAKFRASLNSVPEIVDNWYNSVQNIFK